MCGVFFFRFQRILCTCVLCIITYVHTATAVEVGGPAGHARLFEVDLGNTEQRERYGCVIVGMTGG